MGTAKVELADGKAAYFNDMARRYQSLALAEQHERQSDLFGTIAADYHELAAAAGQPPRDLTAVEAAEAGAFARWLLRVGRWWRPAAQLQLPAAPNPAK
ncbi:MAG TPA: hypothetical protein VMQ11_08715 [Alphaproteobacteria bacterium]|nr:hypothetical protein [Alphaproteobacteria bacterium]